MSGYTDITLLQYELEKLRAELAEKDEVIAEAGEMLAMRDRQLAELKERRCEEIAKYRDAPVVAYRHLMEDGWEYFDAPTGDDCPKCVPLIVKPGEEK